MVRRVVILVLVAIFMASGMPAFSDAGTDSTSEKSVFQKVSDDISEIGEKTPGQKETPLAERFQDSYDYIVESSPKAKALSLRGNEREIKRRRGQK